MNVAANGGGDRFQYPKWLQYATWTESAGFAVVEKAQYIAEINRQVRAANSLSLWEVTAKDIKYFNKGSKWIGFAGPVGDFANLGLTGLDAWSNGFTWKHANDLMYGAIGFSPILGDFISLEYTITDGKLSSDYNPNTPMIWESQMMGKF